MSRCDVPVSPLDMGIDCHMHTWLCGHATGEPMDYVNAAKRQGLQLITFTCHIPMEGEAFGQAGIRMKAEELGDYVALIHRTAEEARELGVEVLCGIEAEVFPEAAPMTAMDAVLASQPFDFVLGSLHAQMRSYRQWLEAGGFASDAARADIYFRHLAAGVRSGRYDSMAHPDVVRTYGVVREFRPAEHEGVIRDFLAALVECDVCMEVNTSGLTKGAFEVHPDPLILDWAAEMGVALTLGSDSHRPESVGQFFDTVLPMLRSKGFEKLHYFKNRRRHSVPI